MGVKRKSVLFTLVVMLILLCSGGVYAVTGDGSEHRTKKEELDSLAAALPFLEDKVASTIKNGGSTPVAFYGYAQLITLFHNYYNLPREGYVEVESDKSTYKVGESYLYPARAGIDIGTGEPIVKFGVVVSPGRNTVLWAKAGISASFQGVKPIGPAVESGDEGFNYISTHHSDNRTIGIFEDMSAGIAIRTKPASFKLQMGAVNWREASPLSIWKAQPKMFAWEYLPYEENEAVRSYYENNIAKGEQTGRSAWNKKAFQGIDFSITDLPGNVKGYFLYGSAEPYDMFERYAIDMAVDLGYAGDEGSIIETGIADSYRKNIFYRLSKKFNESLEVGFNNGYIMVSPDLVNAGFKYDFVFNSKFDIGLYNSIWDVNGTKTKLNSTANYNSILANGIDTAKTVGEGFYLKPKTFSIDLKGKINSKFSYFIEPGFSVVDTEHVSISNISYLDNGQGLTTDGTGFSKIEDSNDVVEPGRIDSSWTSTGWNDMKFAGYMKLEYNSKVNVIWDLMFAQEGYNSPFSYIMSHDLFFARGSGELGPGKFLGAETSPYTQNMIATGLTVKPTIPWYGHLKFKYGINKQINDSRDVIFMNYRLNGFAMHSTFSSTYAKWGLGKLTQTYDFTNNQSIALAPLDRVGDESYGSYILRDDDNEVYSDRVVLNPASGGLRSDAHSVYEGFVPYSNPANLILNHYSKSSVVDGNRNIAEIWNDSERRFVDIRDSIGAANGGKGTMIIDKNNDTTYYSMSGSSMTKTDTKGNSGTPFTVDTTSSNGFVPVHSKNSFNFIGDWALDLGRYINYKNDLFISIYYEFSGITKEFSPMAFNYENSDVMLLSHYIRSEPAIAITPNFYVLGLIGWEKWLAGTTWLPNYANDGEGHVIQDQYGHRTINGFKQSEIKTTDLAFGIGFDWDVVKSVSLHGRYKWYNHRDENIGQNNYDGQALALEIKAFF